MWRRAQKVAGVPVLNKGGEGKIQWVSCTWAGNCGAGGYYTGGSSHHQVLVVSQVHDTWHTAIPVPGVIALNTGGQANIGSMSCTSAGNCSAGGYYTIDNGGRNQAVLVCPA